MRLPVLVVLMTALALGGCGASRQSVAVAAVNAPVPATQARIVIGRKPNPLYAQGIKMKIIRDGEVIGALAPSGYLAWEQPPGKTLLNIEGVALPLTLEPGRSTCVEAYFANDGSGVQVAVVDPGNYDRLIGFTPPEKNP